MKNFIQNKLRLMLESFGETIVEGINYSTKEDLERLKFTLVDCHKEFGKDPYFMSDGSGDAILRVSVNNKGIVVKVDTPIQPAHIAKSNLGLQSDMSGTYKVFQVLAGRGVEHPGTYKQRDEDTITRKMGRPEYDIRSAVSPEGELVKYRVAKPGSPASDAVIKTYINYGDIISDFVKTNMEGYDAYTDADDSGAEIAAAKNSPELAAKVQGKMDVLDKQQANKSRSLPADMAELVNKKGELVDELGSLKRVKGSDSRNRQKELKIEINKLDAEIKRISDDRSGKAEYLRNKNK